MKQIDATVTERGQVTIPAEVRRKLGLNERGKVTFVIEDGVITIRKPRFTVRSLAGIIPAQHVPEELLELSERAKDAKARESGGERAE